MVFKLVRIDTQEPCKIQLTIGKHVIGRGKFLHNDETDKRVSRNHAELEVTPNTVKLKSLHQNPCFFMKKSIETHLLHQDTMVSLCHGDKFGLLPDHFWYEVIHCPDQDSVEERPTISKTNDNGVHNDEEERMDQAGVREQGYGSSDNGAATAEKEEEAINSDDSLENSEQRPTISETTGNGVHNGEEDRMDQARVREQGNGASEISAAAAKEKAINFNVSVEEADALRSASPSLLTVEEDAATQVITEPATEQQVTNVQETAEPVTVKSESVDQDTEPYVPLVQVPTANDARSPAKREHSSTESSPVDVKKVKIERVDADAAAGPSNGQQASSDSNSKGNAAPASPARPAPSRERCIYGANCYRRNPQHKAQFSHPSDADWGAAERGECPYGSACRRRDPRHWDTHTHPPGTQPPAHGPRPGNRQRRWQRDVSVSSDDDVADSPARNLIVTGKRVRKTVHRQDWSDAESDEDKDPYGTDESDEWQPPSDVTNSQGFSQD